jgi:SAM-dependent methyltransferase
MLDNVEKSESWDSIWKRHLQGYIDAPPRTGIFIHGFLVHRIFPEKIKSIMEVGGGSCRDGIYLAKQGYDVICSDKNGFIMDELSAANHLKNLRFEVQDAFLLGQPDRSFSIVFSNGLIVYFNDDNDVVRIIREHVRVSKKCAVIMAHNRANNSLVNKFKRLGSKDPLFNIRFFYAGELVDIVNKAGIRYKKLHVLKFGGIFDALLYEKICGRHNPFHGMAYCISLNGMMGNLYQYLPWRFVERVACIIELEEEDD